MPDIPPGFALATLPISKVWNERVFGVGTYPVPTEAKDWLEGNAATPPRVSAAYQAQRAYWLATAAESERVLTLAPTAGSPGPEGAKGDKGDQGDQGDPGEQGDPGAAAASNPSYIALLSQDGLAHAPTASIKQNDLGAVGLTRFTTGTYRLTLAGAFPIGRTGLQVATMPPGLMVWFTQINENIVAVSTAYLADYAGSNADVGFDNLEIRIEVFPA